MPLARWIRSKLRRIYPLRSTYHLGLALLDRLRWGRRSVWNAYLDQVFEQADPWSYAESPMEFERFRSALNLLDAARNGRIYNSALEVGCAEGVFTEMLASRCQSLLAVDITPAALARAGERCAGKGITFSHWDLSTSSVPNDPDLLVIMDVLEYFFRPADVRDARDKLVSALRPGGHLLLGNSRQDLLFETTWWGKYMLRGGKRIAEFFSEHPRLELIAMQSGEIYVNAIYRTRDQHPAEESAGKNSDVTI